MDEQDGCPTEALILCGFQQTPSDGDKLNFLTCVDEAEGEPRQRAKTCATQNGLNYGSIETCADGSEGQKLLQQAADYHDAHKADIKGYPTILIDGKAPWTRDWGTLMRAFCDAGVSSACGSPPEPAPGPSPAPVPSPMPVPEPIPSPSPVPIPSPVPPVPSPGPSPSHTHYGKPSSCLSDETVISTDDGASVCAPGCPSGGSCPSDAPGGKGGLFGEPGCGDAALSKYCVVTCFDDSDCFTADGFSCHNAGSLGVCAVSPSRMVLL